MLFKKKIFSHKENLMKYEGAGLNAIDYFNSKKNKNLFHLLKNRYGWMNKYIQDTDIGIEVGSGHGLSKKFIKNMNLKITDMTNHNFLDYTNIDALDTKFESNKFDYVISSNVIHHLAFPTLHLKEIHRILNKGGRYIIQDVHCSLICKLVLILMKHEGYDFTVDVYNESEAVKDYKDLWSGNNAISNLIFDDIIKFQTTFSNYFEIVNDNYDECFDFLNSGGVTAKTIYVPLNDYFNKLLIKFDYFIANKLPKIFALQRQIVLKKI